MSSLFVRWFGSIPKFVLFEKGILIRSEMGFSVFWASAVSDSCSVARASAETTVRLSRIATVNAGMLADRCFFASQS